MKVNKTLNETTNSRVYNLTVNEKVSGCPICPPHRGCNRNKENDNNWKQYRNFQWKEKND